MTSDLGILTRQSRTTTVWTCSRCGAVEHVEGTGQPKWSALLIANPPRHAEPVGVALLCKRCDEDLADFLHDTTGEAATERDTFRAALREGEKA